MQREAPGDRLLMKNKRYLPLNLAGLALVAMLWQAEVSAQTAKPKDGAGRVKARSGGRYKFSRRVVKRHHIRSFMRQRAAAYEPMIAMAARKYSVDPRVLWTIAYLETRFRPEQVSPKGARGMMQFIPGTARRFNLINPYDAGQSIDAAARYVAVLTKQFNGRLDLVLASYNAGEGAVDCYLNGRTSRPQNGKVINPRGVRTGGVPPYRETQRYVSRGVLVFSRVTSAAVFSPELLSVTRTLRAPAMPIAVSDQLAINGELASLGGTPAAVLYSARAAVNGVAPVANGNGSEATAGTFDTVFFDLHSGERYLVKGGQIVKQIETVADEAAEDAEGGHREVSKSVYLGSRGE